MKNTFRRVITAIIFWQYVRLIVDEKNALATDSRVVDASMYDEDETCEPISPNVNVASFNGSLEVSDYNFNNFPIFEKQNATLNCSITTSINVGIKYLKWKYPENVEKKIIIGNSTEIRHEKFVTFFQLLSIYNVTKNDDGNYTCKIIDDHCNIKEFSQSLHVEDLDSVFLNVNASKKSNVVIVRAGESSAEFIATIEAFPKHSSTWYDPKGKKINVSTSNGKYSIIENGPEIKLKIRSLKVNNSGIYRLKVSNSWNATTLNFTLIVQDKPSVIISNKAPLLMKPNLNYSIECIATGYPVPQIVWSSKTCNHYPFCENNTHQVIPISHYKDSVRAYEVNSTLNFKSNESTIIRCEANNSLGSSNASWPLLLTEYGTGVITRKSFLGPIIMGDSIELSCAVSKYLYMDNVTWIFENKKVLPSKEIQIKKSVTTFSYVSILSITNIQKIHSGRYTCQASLNNSSLTKNYILTNYDHLHLMIRDSKTPSILQSDMNNRSLHVFVGQPVNILMEVDGSPPLSVVWYKDGKPLFSNDRVTISKKLPYRSLTIANVSKEDEGLYSFVVTNRVGTASDRLQLLIQDSDTTAENVNYINYIFGFSIFLLHLLAFVVFWYIRHLRKEKKNMQRVLQKYGLEVRKETVVPALDPSLGVEERSFLIPYNREKYEFSKEKLEFGKVLGSGEFGIVKKAVADGIIAEGIKTTVAVKVAKEENDSSFIKALASEMKIMIYLGQHPYILNLLGVCSKGLLKGELAIIVEYCEYGNLRDFLLKQRHNFVNQINEYDEIDFTIQTAENNRYENIPLHRETDFESTSENTSNEDTRNELHGTISPIKTSDLIQWAQQVASGMEFLASHHILHGDLAARNVLLTAERVAKVCDFGYSKNIYGKGNYKSHNSVFPIKWMAVESIRDQIFSTQSDIWSFGITMWEIFSLSASPYPGLEHENLLEKLLTGYRLQKPRFVTNKIYSLMTECWHDDPKCRPTFTRLSNELKRFSDQTTNTSVIGDSINQYVCMNANIPNVVKNPIYLEMTEVPNSF